MRAARALAWAFVALGLGLILASLAGCATGDDLGPLSIIPFGVIFL